MPSSRPSSTSDTSRCTTISLLYRIWFVHVQQALMSEWRSYGRSIDRLTMVFCRRTALWSRDAISRDGALSLLEGRSGRVFAVQPPVDMRKGFNGLESIITQAMNEDPLSGDTFVFVNRRGQILNAFCGTELRYVIISKRLEQGRLTCRCRRREVD